MSLLQVSHVSRAFGGLRAVQDVSLNVPAGSLSPTLIIFYPWLKIIF